MRRFAIMTLLVSVLMTIGVAAVAKALGGPLRPGAIMFYAMAELILVNIAIFIYNLFFAMKVARRAKTESELEAVMVPALTGGIDHVSARMQRVGQVLVIAGIGVFIAGLALHFLHW